jgi:hypothetical protein
MPNRYFTKSEGTLILIDGQLFDPSSTHFAFPLYHRIGDMRELAKLRQFTNLTSANFCGSGLDDRGLHVVAGVTTIAHLNLQDTCITNQGLRVLAHLPRLTSLRLKENAQISNACLPYLLTLTQLEDLQIHETAINQDGLDQLTVMASLRDICISVYRGNYSFDRLLALSTRMPQCAILAKGHGTFLQGVFSGSWDQRA